MEANQKVRAQVGVSKSMDQLSKTSNNAAYRSSLMDVEKFKDCEFVSDRTRYEELIEKNCVRSQFKIIDDMICVFKERKNIKIKSHIMVASAILQMSKAAMWKAWYDLEDRYGEDRHFKTKEL